MDRKAFKQPFWGVGLTNYPCPTCNKGSLKAKEDTFLFKETTLSIRSRQIDVWWDPELMEYVYSCLFECTNTSCKEMVSSSGIGSLSEDYSYDEHGEPDIDYTDYFIPKYFSPHLLLFKIPKNAAENVSNEINKSFSLFFSDPASSANHIRIALEYLLTHLKIKRFTTRNGKRTNLSLHHRIDLLPRKLNHIKEMALAVKWLGNAGSHSQHEITADDVLDSYELIEDILIEVFTNKRKNLKVIAKRINKKKGPR